MKWFGVDSDTPNDPKIRALLVNGGRKSNLHAQARMGGLFLVWCHIADHGAQPGRGVSADGSPIDLQEIADAGYFESVDRLTELLDFCAARKHIDQVAWSQRREIFFPAMAKRADEYTKKVQRRAAKSGDAPASVPPVSGHPVSAARTAPDSPVGTVGPVGLVVPPDDPSKGQSRESTPARERLTPLSAGSHKTHAACGPAGACVPAFLHQQFCDRLAGVTDAADDQLRAYYRRVYEQLDGKHVVGQPVKFWEQHFEAFLRATHPTAILAGPTVDRRRDARGASHTAIDRDKYAGIGVRDDDDAE